VAVSVTKGFDAEYLKKEIARQEAARQREAGREARREAVAREAGQPGAAARYYTAAAGQWEPPGRWIGKAAPRLGLTGEVTADVLDRVFVGQRAPDGTQLGRSRSNFTKAGQKALEQAEQRIAADPSLTEKQKTEIRYAELQKVPHAVAYYDYTFSVPKSVSVQWMAALSDAQAARDAGDLERAAALDAEADVIVKAVEAGSDAMIAFVEGRQYVRTGAHTATSGAYRDADGLTVASFTQFTSRDGDPQLHVHNAIANAASPADGHDGQYRALAAEHLWKWKWVGDAIAQEVMRERLEDGLGLHMTLNADGTGYEFDGSPQDVRDAFSSRRVRITGELAPVVAEFEREYGRPPTRNQLHSMRQELAVRTRDAKPGREPDPQQVLAQWAGKARAREVEVAGRVRASTQAAAQEWRERVHVPGGVPGVPDAGTRSRCMQAGVAEVQRHHATWDEAQLWRAIWKFSHELPERGRIEYINGMVADVLEGRAEGAEVVRLGPSVAKLDLAPLGLRADGTPVHVRPMAERYCTPGQLALEDYLVATAGRPGEQQITIERSAELAATAGGLSADQREATVGLLSSGRAVDVLSGSAGTGKTTTMAAFCRAFREETGHRVIGVAASTTAAREMTAAGFDETYNAADFLGKIKGSDETRGHRELHPGEVLVVDEAGATGNQDLAALMRAAQNRGARVILTGDTKQLDAPGQGGGMRLIEQAHGAHRLTEVHRFHQPWEGPASLRLRDGDASVDAEYAGRGRTREGTQDEMRRQAVDGWLADHLGGKQALLVASDNATAAELAAQARDRLIGLGRVADRADVVLGRDGNEGSTGDLVIARANAKDIDAGGEPLANRHALILDGWTGEGAGRQATVRRQTGDGWTAPFTVPASYLERDGQLGYAGNTHIAQARTVDTCHEIVTDATVAESQYVGATRGRELNMRYTVTNRPGQADLRAEPAPATGGKEPPVIDTGELVRLAAMDHSGAELTATETIRAAQDEQERMPFLVDVLRATTRDANTAAVDQILRGRLSEHDYQRYQGDYERGLLQQRVREMQLAGHDPTEVLTKATERDMEGARSIAGVLHGRLGRIEQDAARHASDRPGRGGFWAASVPAPGPGEELAELARQAAAAADERTRALGEQTAADPPDWALNLFGDVPDEPHERQHWIDGAAAVASYRELTGHDDPEQGIGEAPPAWNAEWRASWRQAAQAVGYDRTEVAHREATDGELHADRMAGQRAAAQAPPDVAEELRYLQGALAHLEQQEVRETDPERVASSAERAALIQDGEAELDAEQQQRIEWDTEHTADQEAARHATGELQRRGIIEPGPEPEPEPAMSRAELGGESAAAGTGRQRGLGEAYMSLDYNEPYSYMALEWAERQHSGGAGLAEPEIDEPELDL